jgi:hypothetical protein
MRNITAAMTKQRKPNWGVELKTCAEFIDTDDKRWRDFLKITPHDFYHLPEYVSLEAAQEGGAATAFYAEHGAAKLLVPLLLRGLPPLLGAPVEWRDAVNPYGYPSPLFVPDGESEQSEEMQFEILWQAFCDVAAAQNIVSVFLRLHPLLPLPPPPLEKQGQLLGHGQTIFLDGSTPGAQAFAEYSKGLRYDIRRLQSAGFTVVLDDWNYYQQFIEIYHATMQRLNADEMYYFSKDYFARLRAALGERLHLAIALSPNGEVAAGTLITTSCGIVQYHLAATADEYRRYSPAKLLVHWVRDWAHERGEKQFHLGGGLGGREDSLFRFKAGFSTLRADFFTYRLILDSAKYQHLVALWQRAGGRSEDGGDFFPAYRRALP